MVNNKVTLVDISFWNDSNATPEKVDFVKMKESGIDGVIIRIGQNTWIDEDYLDYVAGAKAAGIPYGIYWFWDSRSTPESQAKRIYDLVVNDQYPPLGIWGDYEERYGGAYSGIANFKKFMLTLGAYFPSKELGIYTGYYYWLENTKATDREWATAYPLWIANYGADYPLIPANWKTFRYWQYTDRGDGILHGTESTNIDMNVFNGTLEDFYKMIGGTIPPVEGGKPMLYKGTITATALNIRPQPNTIGAPYYSKPNGTLLEADSVIDGWWHLTKIDGQPVTQESYAYEGATKAYIRTDEITTEPTVPEQLPAYLLAFDANGVELGKYTLVG